MKHTEFVTQWVLDTVKNDYANDIALVLSHNTLRIDENSVCMSHFVPITPKGNRLARTFILDGVGYDIWGMSWERLENFANLHEYNITVLADAQVLYARTPEDRARFEELQQRLAANLANPTLQRAHALESFARAKDIFSTCLFAKGSDVKMGAGYVLDYLARAICFTYGRYFKKSQTDQLTELRTMGPLPNGFEDIYNAVIHEKSEEVQKRLCFQAIRTVEDFLTRPETITPSEHSYQDLADWYQELSYTWLRLQHYATEGNVTKVYMWGIMLQNELNQVCSDFGLTKMELMSAFDAENLSNFAAHASVLEQQVRQAIANGGGHIREYRSREEFLDEV